MGDFPIFGFCFRDLPIRVNIIKNIYFLAFSIFLFETKVRLHRGSNPGPLHYKCSALPLSYRALIKFLLYPLEFQNFKCSLDIFSRKVNLLLKSLQTAI